MRLIVLVGVLLYSLHTLAENKVFLSIENKNSQVGDDIVFNIQCSAEKNAFVIFPDYSTLLQPLEIIPPITYDTIQKGRNTLYSCFLHLRAWDSTILKIPALPIIMDNSSTIDTLYTKAQSLSISMIFADTTKPIKDIFPPISKRVTFWQKFAPYFRILKIALILFLLLAMVLGILYYFGNSRKKIKRTTNYIPQGVSPYNWCLYHIQKAESIESKDMRYGRLSEILRLYLAYKFAIPALTSTTEEFLPRLATTSIKKSLQEDIAAFLLISDAYKFSPHPNNESQTNEPLISIIKKLEKDALG
jgi:hypothetical protein